MSLHVNNDLLQDIELEIRKLHSKLIVAVAYNIMEDPSKIKEMKKKYLKQHQTSNIRNTLRPPRKYMNKEQTEQEELRIFLKKEQLKEELEDIEHESHLRCRHMVRVDRLIRQCKHYKDDDSDFCSLHEDELIHPFGLKKIIDKDEDNNDFLSSDEDIDNNYFLSSDEDIDNNYK
jgi:hypothetical protein